VDRGAARSHLRHPGHAQSRHVADNLGALSGPLPDAALRRRMAEHFNSL